MKRHPPRLALLLTILCVSPFMGYAQPFPDKVYDGLPDDSAVFSFASGQASRTPISFSVSLDTSHATLWRTGTTSKSFFSAGISGRPGIMTDTALSYPRRANDWFALKIGGGFINPIISFTHKYQTDSAHDGGVVEYSFDSLSWNNVAGGCFTRTVTDSFYTVADTLSGNVPGFSGTSAWKRSRFQLFQGIPIKSSSGCSVTFPIWVRFRFLSDSTVDSLAGWIIRSITVEKDIYSGAVNAVTRQASLNAYPNPSRDGLVSWPALEGEDRFTLCITDALGRTAYKGNYLRQTNLRSLPSGVYYYRVNNGVQDFAGVLIKE